MAVLRRVTQDAMMTALTSVSAYSADTDDRPWEEVLAEVEAALAMAAADSEASDDESKFDGAYYDPAVDDRRLEAQIGRVFEFMLDGKWHSLSRIGLATGDPPASVSAQLRHLRKAKHGAWIVDVAKARNKGNGLYVYRLRNPDGSALPPVRPNGLKRFRTARPPREN